MEDVKKKMASDMINATIHALNCGSEEALEYASEIRQQALASGDDELIQTIEYLWKII